MYRKQLALAKVELDDAICRDLHEICIKMDLWSDRELKNLRRRSDSAVESYEKAENALVQLYASMLRYKSLLYSYLAGNDLGKCSSYARLALLSRTSNRAQDARVQQVVATRESRC